MTATLNPLALAPALLEKSRAYCRTLTRRHAKNFYYGLKLLPEPKRSAMYALYAYMRLVDDIADDESHQRSVPQRQADLDHWQSLTHEAYAAAIASPCHLVTLSPCPLLWPAFIDLLHTCRIPEKIFDDMITGQRQDLTPGPIQTFADLHQYCYRVASVVGLASLYVWGFEGGQETLDLGIDRGIAFQLTNVLRDLREDSARAGGGRCYIPTDELAQHGFTLKSFIQFATQIENRKSKIENYFALMQFQIARARSYYEKSAPLDTRISQDSRPTLAAMTAIYRAILEKIAAHPARVLTGRIRLSTPAKLLLAWRALRS